MPKSEPPRHDRPNDQQFRGRWLGIVEGSMDTVTAIRTRRSIRDYENRTVKREIIADILWDAAQAPTTPVSGPFFFHVIEGVARIADLGRARQAICPRASPRLRWLLVGRRIRLQSLSRRAGGDRDLGSRRQFPVDPGPQPRGTEPHAFGTRSWARQLLGRCADAVAAQPGDAEGTWYRRSLRALRGLCSRLCRPRCHHRTRANGRRSCGFDVRHKREQHKSR